MDACNQAKKLSARKIVNEVIEGLQDRNEGFGPVIKFDLRFDPSEAVRDEVARDLEVLLDLLVED
jgi:hypothetical protein